MALLTLATYATPARANGRFPQASQLAFSPGDPDLVVMRTTFGLLVSHDDGATWRWICEAAIGLGGAQEDPYYGVTAAGAIVGGLWQGLSVSPDTGCTWAFAGGPLAHQFIADIVVRPDDPHTVLALTATWASDAGGVNGASGNSYATQVFRSTDDGAHWAALGLPIDPTVKASTIEVARSDPHRIYVTGTRGTGATRTAQLFVSLDDGSHWTERAIPLLADVETGVFIGAVDPAKADLLYIRTDGHSRLLVTGDAGQSFESFSFAQADGGTASALAGYMFGFALSPDGSKIYAGGGTGDGLFVGARGSSTLVHRSDVFVQCLAARDSELWACSNEGSGFIIGMSTDDGSTFAPKFHMDAMQGVIVCAPGSGVAQCEAQLPAQCALLGGCTGGDAGAPSDAGEDAAAVDAGDDGPPPESPSPPKPRGSCTAGGSDAGLGLGAVSLLLAAASRARRRRKH